MPFRLLGDEDAAKAIDTLEKEYPNAKDTVNFSNPLELMVAMILAAQARDDVVNAITPALFKRYRTAADYAGASFNELVGYVRRVPFAGNKAKNIIAACKAVYANYNGRVPSSMNELLDLPGIGRKTANIILINGYGIVEGIPVDRWVIKLSGRIGLSKGAKPDEIEKDLMKKVERKHWKDFAFVLKHHGRKICQSTTPICSRCVINKLCPRNGVASSK